MTNQPLNIDKRYDPTPEENRAAIAAVKAKLSDTASKLYNAKVVDYPIGNSVLVEANADEYRIIVATISKNFIGEAKANKLAAILSAHINKVA